MNFIFLILMFLVFSISSASAETLEERIKKMEETIQKQQEVLKEQQKALDELKELANKEKSPAPAQTTQQAPPVPPPAATTAQPAAPEQMQKQLQELKETVGQVVEAQKKYVPSVFNPSIGFVGETIFSYNSKGSKDTGSDRPGGFDVFQRSVELNASAFVDPFARGYMVINASADPITGEATATVEEAALLTTSLPWNLTLQAGRFFGEFGRLAYIHDHELPFVNRPLVLDKYIGGESRTDGLQLNYLLPTSHYVSVTLGVGNSFGSPPNNPGDYRQFSALNFWGRASTYFDLTPDVSLETGVSGLLNPSTIDRGGALLQPDGSMFTQRERRLVGADLVLAYRPLRNNQFKSLTWGTEVLYSDNRYDVNSPVGAASSRYVGSFGLYSYLAYKFHRQWTTGFLFEWMENAQNNQAQTYGYSPYITWALSHWNQLRLQYTHTDNNAATGLRSNDAIYLQWSWIIGSHAHGWQQR
ncbi:MAG: hypothetical protein ABSF48_01640 [Thermodesulfobacteriota bacterium]|jgi:hypothetical protein